MLAILNAKYSKSRDKPALEAFLVLLWIQILILITDLWKPYQDVARLMGAELQLCMVHAKKAVNRYFREVAKEKPELCSVLKELLDKMLQSDVEIGRMLLSEMIVVLEEMHDETAKWFLKFLRKHGEKLLAKKTNNAAETIFSLFEQLYDNMKYLRNSRSADLYLKAFAVHHDFKVFKRGKRKGKCPLEILGFELESRDWLDYIGFGSSRIMPRIWFKRKSIMMIAQKEVIPVM